MRHNIPVEHFGVQGVAMATTVENCVHCGLCLPACPTYQLLGQDGFAAWQNNVDENRTGRKLVGGRGAPIC